MFRRFELLRSALVLLLAFSAAVRVGAEPPRESIEQRMCNDTCRNTYLQCLLDGGFADEGPFEACRAAYKNCRIDCEPPAQRPAATVRIPPSSLY